MRGTLDTITVKGMEEEIRKLNSRKTTDFDGLGVELFICGRRYVKQISVLWAKLRIPKRWLRAVLIPVFRMTDMSGISLLLINLGCKMNLYQPDPA